MTTKAAFEAKATELGLPIERSAVRADWYAYSETNMAWQCWQAAEAAERERCAKLCDDISDEYQRTEGRRYQELKSDAQEGAATCADRIRAGA